jgi:hypothetical protein
MTDNFDNLRYNRPSLFKPSIYRELGGENTIGSSYTLSDSSVVVDTAVGESSSFRYDPPDTGIKSTQQLCIDWTDFTAHTFFNSAQVKVNSSYEKIINEYPFDGTQKEYELFVDGLTGYEKYTLDSFPKNVGYLFLSGTSGSEATGGTYVVAKDIVGADYPYLVENASGEAVLNPHTDSMTIEFFLFLPPVSSSNQYVLNKLTSAPQGFSAFIGSTGSLSNANITFDVVSGSSHVSCSTNILKNQFNHIAFVWNRIPNINSASIYVNQSLCATSLQVEIDDLNIDSADFIVGSGSATTWFTPQNTLSGALDELRIWHSIRSTEDRSQYAFKNVFSSDDLKLCYRFNEPSGSNTRLVLDHSGKGLHGQLSTAAITLGVREKPTGSVAGPAPLIYEKLDLNPILFPSYPTIASQRSTLLVTASYYDSQNPNLITKLVPPNMLEEGQAQDALSTEEGSITTTLNVGTDPNSATLGQTQVLLYLLWTWAKYFDELKMFLDAFGNLYYLDYTNHDTTPDQFLQFLARYNGVTLPSLFVGSSLSQFIYGDNLDASTSYSTSQYSLQYIQNQIWRRILINLKDILDSKGTIHSIKAYIRTLGIDPDNIFRIREYGGATKKALKLTKEKKSESTKLLDFSGGGFAQSAFLSGSRVEPGFPSISLTIPADNGLYTSGSWTVEEMCVLPHNTSSLSIQSLMRLETTGSFAVDFKGVIANLVAYSGSGVELYICPNGSASAPCMSMSVSPFDPMDGQPWFYSFGKERGDKVGYVSSSFFLRAARSSFGDIVEEYTSSVYFDDKSPSTLWNALTHVTGPLNASGSFLMVGSQSLLAGPFLNSSSISSDARYTNINGKIGQIRFWSKALSSTEWREHVRNFKSLGVTDPTTNFNFVTTKSGSFERLRMDVSCDQPVSISNGMGNIPLFDFSQNNLHMTGTAFPIATDVLDSYPIYYSFISPYYDQAVTTNKVRVRSFQDENNILNNEDVYTQTAPLYEIEPSEEPHDNTKFTIDFSIVDALNQDIMGIFANLDIMDNAIGSPELLFADEYPTLSTLRDIYFNRLTDKVNLKNFFSFYQWFDTNIGSFIAKLIPRKASYNGINFLIESTALERPKFQYQFADQYLGEKKQFQRDSMLLQFFMTTLKRY